MSLQEISHTSESVIQLASFRVGRYLFGVDVMKVQEVLQQLEMTKVPLANGCIQGLINLRGQIIPAIDLCTRLQVVRTAPQEDLMNVVVHTAEGVVSLLVESIGDVLELSGAQHEAVPGTLPPHLRDLLSGVFKLDKGLVLHMNVDQVARVGMS